MNKNMFSTEKESVDALKLLELMLTSGKMFEYLIYKSNNMSNNILK